MTSPVIEHLDAFEEEIAAICRQSLAEHDAAQDERREGWDDARLEAAGADMRERRRIFQEYALACFHRRNASLPVFLSLAFVGILAVAWIAEQRLAVL